MLKRRGAGRAVISEAAQIRSASALLLFTPRRDLGDFDMGRLFYRLWLEIAALGAGMVPMSALADFPRPANAWAGSTGFPRTAAWPTSCAWAAYPPGGAARSPRLPVDERLV